MSEMDDKRMDAAQRIKSYGDRGLGFLGTVRKPVHVNGKRTGNLDRTTWMVLQNSAPKPLATDSVEGTEISLFVAALEWSSSQGGWSAPLDDLAADDLVQVNNKWLTVFLPGPLAPSGIPIMYNCRAGVRKGVA